MRRAETATMIQTERKIVLCPWLRPLFSESFSRDACHQPVISLRSLMHNRCNSLSALGKPPHATHARTDHRRHLAVPPVALRAPAAGASLAQGDAGAAASAGGRVSAGGGAGLRRRAVPGPAARDIDRAGLG